MTTPSATTAEAAAPELKLTRHFKAERQRVFAAFTKPEQLAKWFGPEGCTCPDAEADARVGGAYRLPIVGDESCDVHTVVGKYIEVVADERLVFTWSWLQEDGEPGQRMVVTLTLADVDGGTDLTLHQIDFADEEIRDKHSFGWSSSFNSLDTLLAGT